MILFGLGGQEILLLFTCCAFPAFVGGVTLLVFLNRKKLPPRDQPADDDWAAR
ncbi:MAG: hypothetical protein K2P78_06010 [Gemmataceae bacterium]|nr:hypothetical protein [Gemmataceae bacterium]